MTRRVHKSMLILVGFMLASVSGASAQHAASRPPGLTWTRDYAIPYTDAEQSTVKAKLHEQLNLSPRFLPTLGAAFPQRQWFWKDHGRFWTVAEVAQTFLGIPGRSWDVGASAWIDDDRYVSEEGCVPHDCFDRGLLWIDTDADSPVVIFALTQLAMSPAPDGTHMWVFVSRKKMNYPLPAAFQRSAKRWYDANQAQGYKENVLLATVVTTDGEQHDISFEDVVGKTAGATR